MNSILKLQKYSSELRKKTFIKFYEMGEAHLGGSFSMIELLVFIKKVTMQKNDKFILSKSHASLPYLLMLKDQGFNPELKTHLEIAKKNLIHCTTGSLGHGLPVSVGIAMANKFSKKKSKVFVLISDGECQEGTTWESLLLINKFKLNNLIILVDYNKVQALTSLKDGLPLDNLQKKFTAFNLNVINIKNGHSFEEMSKKINTKKIKKPTVIIFNTIKGKGIKKFENDPGWHARRIKESDYEIARKELKL